MNGIFEMPVPVNEPVYAYAPGSSERQSLKEALQYLRSQTADIPMMIGGKEIRTGNTKTMHPPHDRAHCLGHFHRGDATHVNQAIEAALAAKPAWENMAWEERASIFIKAAELISGPYRYLLNASTMLAQSKNAHQAEIDAVCEMIDFLRFNVTFMRDIYAEQPISSKGVYNRLEYRPLEGFVFALTPFNFTAIAGNLPTSAAMMGNVVVWKPADAQIFSAWMLMKIFREAGLPDGVINLIYTEGPVTGKVIFEHPDFAGIHFTGSTGVFQQIWKDIGLNIHRYKSYPRIVGETGGKDFIVAHPSADKDILKTAIIRGAYEFQGQKCSAASRVYIPKSLWAKLEKDLVAEINALKVGPVEDFSNFVNAVITESSFRKIASYIDNAKKDPDVKILAGGTYDDSKGLFISPTLLLTENPQSTTMCEEIFGPVLTVYIYEDEKYSETLKIVNATGPYALTGAIISQDRYAITEALNELRHAAGNFYINDKPTGAVVGQQPFGGGRASGTNDKAGAKVNLQRWTSMRTIKETFAPPADYTYPNFKDQ